MKVNNFKKMQGYTHTEREWLLLMQVNGDAPKSVPDPFQASPCISMDLATAARCGYSLKDVNPPEFTFGIFVQINQVFLCNSH